MAAAAFFIKKNSTRSLRKAMSGEKEAKVVATLRKGDLYAIVVDADNYDDALAKADAYAKRENILAESKPKAASAETKLTEVAKKKDAAKTTKPDEVGVNGKHGTSESDDPDGDEDVKKHGTGVADANGDQSGDTNGAGAVADSELADDHETKVPYEPSQFLADEYKNKNKPFARGSGDNDKKIAQLLVSNKRDLISLGGKCAWLVFPVKMREKLSNSNKKYWGSRDKNSTDVPLVIVRSAWFYTKAATQVDQRIMVCNTPIYEVDSKNFYGAAAFYKSIFTRIKNFVNWHNDDNDDSSKKKIDTIALPFLGANYAGVLKREWYETEDESDEEPEPEPETSAKSADEEEDSGEDEEDSKPIVGKHKESSSTGKKHNGAGKEGKGPVKKSKKRADETPLYEKFDSMWIESARELRLVNGKVDIVLMRGTSKGAWYAPDSIKNSDLFTYTVKRFPACISHKKLRDKVESTLFVCDIIRGKRVGNDNDINTTGGCFGLFVPMHFTAEFVDSNSKYEENSLIEMLYL
jgi:hypothetical protein